MLNQPRTIDYDFNAFESDNVLWVCDLSERTYICSATPMIYCTPVQFLDYEDYEDLDLPDSGYFSKNILKNKMIKLEVEEIDKNSAETYAWDEAISEACEI